MLRIKVHSKGTTRGRAHSQAPPRGWLFPLLQCSDPDRLQPGVTSLPLGSPVHLPVSDGDSTLAPDFTWTSLLAAFKGIKTSNLRVNRYLKDIGLGTWIQEQAPAPQHLD